MSRWSLGVFLGLVLLQPGCVLLNSNVIGPTNQDTATLSSREAARACLAVAENLANRGHLVEAIEQLHKSRMYDPSSDVSPALARIHARLRNDQDALDEFNKALTRHPSSSELWNDFGYFHYERGNWGEAERACRKATELDSNNARAWMNLGLALGQKSEYQDSLAAFEKACRPAEARCNLAFVYCTHKKFPEARKLYQEALKLDPGSKLARLGLDQITRIQQTASTHRELSELKPVPPSAKPASQPVATGEGGPE